jgi:hypothetical protein
LGLATKLFALPHPDDPAFMGEFFQGTVCRHSEVLNILSALFPMAFYRLASAFRTNIIDNAFLDSFNKAKGCSGPLFPYP